MSNLALVRQENREGHIDNSLMSKENFNHYLKVAEYLSKSSMVPKNMQGKPMDILIAMEMGLQLNMPMMQAIQDIAVINGKPCMYGDGLLAVVQGHKDFEWIKETYEGEGDILTAVCTIKRMNHEEHTVRFSVSNAKKANLWGKSGVWSQYPARMLQMRARGFCIRDIFSDALKGVKPQEEVMDYKDDTKPQLHEVKTSGTQTEKLKELLDCKVNTETGEIIDVEMVDSPVLITKEQLTEFDSFIAANILSEEKLEKIYQHYGVSSLGFLTQKSAEKILQRLNNIQGD